MARQMRSFANRGDGLKRKVEICGLDTSSLPKLSAKESEMLLVKIKSGEQNARDMFIVGNMRLVLSIIQRFNKNSASADDLFQVGCVGLIKAIDNFDITLNVKFSTYAVPMITGEIRRFLRDSTSVKVTRSIRDVAYKALCAKEEFERTNSKECSVEDIASICELPVSQIVSALDAISEPISIYDSVYNKNGDSLLLMDQLSDKTATPEKWTNDVALSDSLKSLDEKEREILYLRYYAGKTQMEVSRAVGISQAQVSRLEKCALKHMKENIMS